MEQHAATRPAWTCTHCNEPWPCAVRRQQLITGYDGDTTSLRILMRQQLVHAAGELLVGGIHDGIDGKHRDVAFDNLNPATHQRRPRSDHIVEVFSSRRLTAARIRSNASSGSPQRLT